MTDSRPVVSTATRSFSFWVTKDRIQKKLNLL